MHLQMGRYVPVPVATTQVGSDSSLSFFSVVRLSSLPHYIYRIQKLRRVITGRQCSRTHHFRFMFAATVRAKHAADGRSRRNR